MVTMHRKMIFRELQLAFKKNQTKPIIERFTGQSTVNVTDKYLCYLFTCYFQKGLRLVK